MNQSFEVLPFGGELEGEMERSQMRSPRGGHKPFRARYGRRRYFSPPWPYYYGPYYGPGWPYAGPSGGNAPDDDGGPEDAAPEGEFGAGSGCNCPKCRQRATVFEVLPFGR